MWMIGASIARRPRSKQRAYRRKHVYERKVALERERRRERAEWDATVAAVVGDRMARRVDAALRGCRGA